MRVTKLRFVPLLFAAITSAFVPAQTDAGGHTRYLYVAVKATVNVYNASTGALLGAIKAPTGDIRGLAVSLHGDLYLSTFDRRATTIYQYGAGQSQPSFQYVVHEAIQGPLAVSDTGQIAFPASCVGANCGGGPTPIFIFSDHVAQPFRQVSMRDYISEIAYGPGGTLWVASHPDDRSVAYLAPGASSFVHVRLDTALSPISYFPIDVHGDVLSIDPLETVNVFGGRSGKLFHRVAIAGVFERFVSMTLSGNNRLLYIATKEHVLIYRYPEGGLPVGMISVAPISGIALGPG